MNLASLYHQASPPYASPIDAQRLQLTLRTAKDELTKVKVFWKDRAMLLENAEMYRENELIKHSADELFDYWVGVIELPEPRFAYSFQVFKEQEICWLGEAGIRSTQLGDNFNYPYINPGGIAQPPTWLRGTTVYEIFPDRFARNNEVFEDFKTGQEVNNYRHAGGNLEGIASRADYLKELGVGAIYTTPLFTSPSNHKYETEDYLTIDPDFGSNNQFLDLVRELKEHSIHFILDGVFNHSGDTFFAFQDVIANGEQSPYTGWFAGIESFPIDKQKVNYLAFGERYPTMPKLNMANREAQDYFLSVVKQWSQHYGISGWRLDVANEIDPSFLRRLRQELKAIDKEQWILGEVWHEASPWLQGDMFDSVMHYSWGKGVIDFLGGKTRVEAFINTCTKQLFWYDPLVQANLLTLLGSHDTARIRSVLGKTKAHLAAILQFTHYGVPMIYYGDEVGMEGGNENAARGCMDWTKESWDPETLHLYKRLVQLRKDFPWLQGGSWRVLFTNPVQGTLLIERTELPLLSTDTSQANQRILVAINPNETAASIPISAMGNSLLSYNWLTESHMDLSSGSLVLNPEQGVILVK